MPVARFIGTVDIAFARFSTVAAASYNCRIDMVHRDAYAFVEDIHLALKVFALGVFVLGILNFGTQFTI